jgi:hypothetical protein
MAMLPAGQGQNHFEPAYRTMSRYLDPRTWSPAQAASAYMVGERVVPKLYEGVKAIKRDFGGKTKTQAKVEAKDQRKPFNIPRGMFDPRELNHHDVADTVAFLGSGIELLTNSDQVLNSPEIGNSTSQRQGRSIQMYSLDFQYKIRGSGGVFDQVADVIVFIDTQANGADCIAGDVVKQSYGLTLPVLQNSSRFIILKWKRHVLKAMSYYNGSSTSIHYSEESKHMRIPLKIPTTFNTTGTEGLVSVINDNAIQVIVVHRHDTTVWFHSRLRFWN